MNFIFSNDFFTIFCENNTSQNVYTSTTFLKNQGSFTKLYLVYVPKNYYL